MRLVVALSVLLALAVAPTAAAQAPPTIPAGVTVAGTDVSGLTLDQAAQKLYVTDGPILGRPIHVRVAERRFDMSIAQARVKLDVNRSARRAYDAGVAAAGKPVDVPLALTYDAGRVKAFVRGVARRVRVAPRNASVRIGLKHMRKVPARSGRALWVRPLARRIGRALKDPRVARTIHASRAWIKPKVRTRDLARRYPTIVTVDRGRFTLRLFKHLRWVRNYPVAVGQPAYPTPTGLFHVLDKQVNPVWSVPNSPWAGELAGTVVEGGTAANPLKARWMGLGGGIGIHGTGEDASIGTRASHGCIRMHVPDVIALYRRVPIGTPVLIGD